MNTYSGKVAAAAKHQVAVYKRAGRPLDLLVLSEAPAAVKLVDCLLARDAKIKAAACSSDMLIRTLVPYNMGVALRLITKHGAQITDEVRNHLLKVGVEGALSKLEVLMLDGHRRDD